MKKRFRKRMVVDYAEMMDFLGDSASQMRNSELLARKAGDFTTAIYCAGCYDAIRMVETEIVARKLSGKTPRW